MAPHSSTLAWKIPWMEGPGRLQSMGSLSRTRLSDFTFTFHLHALEKEMATQSSVLAWRIPWTEGWWATVYGVAKSRTWLSDWTELNWPVFSAPLVKEIVFNPLYILASFVEDKVSIGVCIYLWAFYFVLLIYISAFVPVPYCLDDCSFVV